MYWQRDLRTVFCLFFSSVSMSSVKITRKHNSEKHTYTYAHKHTHARTPESKERFPPSRFCLLASRALNGSTCLTTTQPTWTCGA